MTSPRALAALALAAVLGPRATSAGDAPRPGVDWPSFRGIAARGIGEGAAATRWNVETGENLRWKTAIPGLGHSSPVVWGDLVCVTTAVGSRSLDDLRIGLYGDIAPVDEAAVHAWKVYCLDKRSGAIRWERTAHSGVPGVKRHPKSTHANSTLAMDGRRVAALFGSEGLYVYDLQGTLLWRKDLGSLDAGFFRVPGAQWGFGSSPVIHEGRVFVQADVQKGSFLAAFDAASGREVWRTPRSDVPTWSTPTVHAGPAGAQVVVNGWKEIGGYDAASGKRVWWMSGGGDIPVPTPVVARGLVFITGAHGPVAPIYAVKEGARGDVSLEGRAASDHVAWSQLRDGAYMQTPLVLGELLYNCRDNGVLSVYEADTGRRLYQQRLGDGRTGFTASPVAADGKVYFTSEEGEVHVVEAGTVFQLLARNPLGELSLSTPALSEGVLFYRTRGYVVAIAVSAAGARP